MSFRKTACFFNLEIENLFLHNSMFFISNVIHVHGIASRSCQTPLTNLIKLGIMKATGGFSEMGTRYESEIGRNI